MKILALCDSPVARPGWAPTGFGKVAKNLFTEWMAAGVEIDVWAIHFDGWGYRDVPYQLFPANDNWNSREGLTAFLQHLASGDYTHVWILMDLDALCVSDFPQRFRALCQKKKIRSMIYFPVDAAQEPDWINSMAMVDVAVTYTDYGRDEALGAAVEWKQKFKEPVTHPTLHVLPHGLETNFKSPGTPRVDARKQIILDGGVPFVEDGDFIILNVNTNSWRKDPLRTMEIVKGLRNLDVPAKLVMRMTPRSRVGGIDILAAGKQLGLKHNEHFALLPPIPEEHLPMLYHASDLYLTSTLGEGWGLGITEALGCGCPVAMPAHTSCEEIGLRILGTDFANIVFLPTEPGSICGDDSRLRNRLDMVKSIDRVEKFYRDNDWKRRHSLSEQTRTWLSWSRIAAEMLKLLKGDK